MERLINLRDDIYILTMKSEYPAFMPWYSDGTKGFVPIGKLEESLKVEYKDFLSDSETELEPYNWTMYNHMLLIYIPSKRTYIDEEYSLYKIQVQWKNSEESDQFVSEWWYSVQADQNNDFSVNIPENDVIVNIMQ